MCQSWESPEDVKTNEAKLKRIIKFIRKLSSVAFTSSAVPAEPNFRWSKSNYDDDALTRAIAANIVEVN